MDLPVPQIKGGIVKLPCKEEPSGDIPVPPGMEDIVEPVQGEVGPTGASATAVR